MMPTMLSELASDFSWQLLGSDAPWSGVAIDNRQVQPGQLFVALCGARHDGHDYVADALARGAAAAIVSRPVAGASRQLLVADTLLALGQVAAQHRMAWSGRMFALTGSAGKTTTKEMLAAILAEGASVHATRGNLNNEIGVPLTLLGLAPEQGSAVLELGAAKPGDIAYLVDLVRPDVSILTNAMPAHLQGFGSLDQVARTKGEIFVAEPGHVAIINADDRYARAWRERAGSARIMAFSANNHPSAEVRASEVVLAATGTSFTLCSPQGTCAMTLAVPGAHNVANALAAAAAALSVDTPLSQIKQALACFGGVPGRMQRCIGPTGLTIIDDTYNANPQAVRSAVDVLAAYDGASMLILGDMAELGSGSETLHREVGEYARGAGIETLLTVGTQAAFAAEAFGAAASCFASNGQLQRWLAEHDPAAHYQVCLVKGSRSAGMEQIVNALMAPSSALAADDSASTLHASNVSPPRAH